MMGVHGKCKLENPCESFCLQKAWHAQFLRKEPRLRSRPFSWLASDVKASRNDHPTRDLQTTANRRLARSRLPGGLLPSSVQLAFARQGAKERGERDDDWRRSDDSYSPRRHWCFRSPTKSTGRMTATARADTGASEARRKAWVRGLRTDV